MAMGLYSLAPMLGPVIEPLTGAWVAEKSRWQRVPWPTSTNDGPAQITGIFCSKEGMCSDSTVCKITNHP